MSTLEKIEYEETAAVTGEAKAETPVQRDWLIKVESARKKYCRDLRRSLWYGLRDVMGALTLRPQDTNELREFEFWAIDDISFELRPGDALGLLGRNGAGKSTLLKLISGQRSLSAGKITTRGRVVALTELGLGFNLALSGRENAYVNAAIFGFPRKAFDAIIEEIIDFSGIREFIDSAVQTYSTGMKARLGFSIATHLNPDVLVVDEVLAVGDLDFRRKCIKHILRYIRRGGSIILVAHDPYLIQSICNRCIVLEKGRLIFDGSGIDGVNFHFEIGRNKKFSRLAKNNTAVRVLGDAVAEAEAAEAVDLSELPPVPGFEALSPEQPIVVDDMQVLAVDGGPLLTGKTVKVVLHYRALHAAEITWGFTICTSDLQTNLASCAKGLDDDPIHVEAGYGVLTAIIPKFPIQPGVYAVRGGIGDGESRAAVSVKGYDDPPHFFTVAPGDISRTANYKRLHSDLFNIDAEWSE